MSWGMLHHPGEVFRSAARRWSKCRVLQLSAAMAYYSIFSLAPLLVIVMALAGWALGPEAMRDQLDDQLRGTLGDSAAETVQSMVESAYQPGKGAWATARSEEHTSELQSQSNLVCRLLLEKKKK